MLLGEMSQATRSCAMAKGPTGYVDLMAEMIGTMLYSLTLRCVAMARRGAGVIAEKTSPT